MPVFFSRELLSTWGGEREAEFAYGSASPPAWLALGGDLEYLTTDRAHGPEFLDGFSGFIHFYP